MARISQARIAGFFARAAAPGATTADIGRALEDLVAYLFEKVPGIEITRRNTMNPFSTEEVDVAFFNGRTRKGLYFLPEILLVECKNWSAAVSSQEVAWFDRKIKDRGLSCGILIAANGITGNAHDWNRAHAIIAGSLPERRHIFVITRNEIETMTSSEDLIRMLKEKMCDLAVGGRLG